MEEFLSFLGKLLLYGGSTIAVAWGAIQSLASKAVDEHFAKRLETFRHEQAKELARMRVEIESVLSGAIRLQDREFTVLPEAWAKLGVAFSRTASITAALQTYPDIFRMQPDERKEYYESIGLRESQKRQLEDLVGRPGASVFEAMQIIRHPRLVNANDAVRELAEYLSANGIFLPRPMKEDFSNTAKALSMALFFVGEIQAQGDVRNHRDAGEKMREAELIRQRLEDSIESRLHSHGRPKASE